MGIRIGKSESGKLYHIVNLMDYGNKFALCGCYLPENTESSREEISKLDDDGKMCERCMYSKFYKQTRY